MARITPFQDVLQKQWFPKIKFIGAYLRPQDLTAAAADYHWRNRLWPPMQVLWAFLVQVLHPGWSSAAAAAEVLAEHAAAGQPLEASADPSAYCQARQHVPESVYRHALRTVGQRLQAKVGDTYRWCGRRVWVVDGSSCSMPDTPELQAAFGQPTGQKQGCGFPVAKLVAMFCWASGAVHDVAIGAYRSNELSLWRQLWDQLQAGEVVLGDRFFGAYGELALLAARGCDGVFRLWGARAAKLDFRRGPRLGKEDRRLVWSKPKERPRTLSPEEFASLPPTLTVRVLRFHTQVPGFRSRTILVATTLRDPVAYPRVPIAALYGDRWTVERHPSYYLLCHSSCYVSGRGLGRANSGICGWFHQVRGQWCRRCSRSHSSAFAQRIQEPCTPGRFRAWTRPRSTPTDKVGLGICRGRLKSESPPSSSARGHASRARARGPIRILRASNCGPIAALNVARRLGGR